MRLIAATPRRVELAGSTPDTVDDVLSFLDQEHLFDTDALVVQGGYFELPAGPDGYSTASLRLASALASRFGGPTGLVRQALLVNDIGLACGARGCSVNRPTGDTQLLVAAGLRSLTAAAGLDGCAPPVIAERTLRNRGLRLAGKVVKQGRPGQSGLVTSAAEGVTVYRLAEGDGAGLPLFEDRAGKQAVKCPLIMAHLYEDMAGRAAGPDGVQPARTLLVDFCRYADRDRVAGGYRAFDRLLAGRCPTRVTLVSVCTNSAGEAPAIFSHTPRRTGG